MRLAFVTFSALLGAASATAQMGSEVQNPANGHLYRALYIPSPLQEPLWEYYESLAQTLGGHLVSVNDAQEEQWLLDAFCGGGPCSADYYIGINDLIVEGQFAWSSGDPVTYTNWKVGEPNNAFGNEDYGEMTVSGGWNDIGSPGDPNNIQDALMERVFSVIINYVGAAIPEEGSTLTLEAQLTGGIGTINYQWYKSGSPINLATNSQYTLTNIMAGDSGAYRCTATDSLGATVSSPSFGIDVFPLGSLTASSYAGLVALALVLCASAFWVGRPLLRRIKLSD